MDQRVTIVTGGGRGIGAATCLRLARDGHDIAFGYLSDHAAAEETAERVRAVRDGAKCIAVQMDTTVEADVDRLFDTAIAELGPITGLVNNAGVTGPLTKLVDATLADMQRVVDVNVIGYLLCMRRAAREMSRGGSIVNISSAAATRGSPGEYVHYAGAKAAVDSITNGLAQELGPEGIRVNSVQSGGVRTRIHEDMGDASRLERRGKLTPLGRPGEPEEIANAVAWLMSDEAAWTTGAVLRVAGGS